MLLAILRLIARPGRISAGAIFFEGKDILARSESQMQQLRGAAISMIFQEPMSSLNPATARIVAPIRSASLRAMMYIESGRATLRFRLEQGDTVSGIADG
jgi:ABC-type microcin C transport system duplicated ATPase subunit YejF